MFCIGATIEDAGIIIIFTLARLTKMPMIELSREDLEIKIQIRFIVKVDMSLLKKILRSIQILLVEFIESVGNAEKFTIESVIYVQ